MVHRIWRVHLLELLHPLLNIFHISTTVFLLLLLILYTCWYFYSPFLQFFLQGANTRTRGPKHKQNVGHNILHGYVAFSKTQNITSFIRFYWCLALASTRTLSGGYEMKSGYNFQLWTKTSNVYNFISIPSHLHPNQYLIKRLVKLLKKSRSVHQI